MNSQYTIPSLSDEHSEIPESSFEYSYLQLRKKENRIYSDQELAQLPDISPVHPYAKEWKIRKQSAVRLTKYLIQKKKKLEILEVGCGNGWLSAKLAEIPSAIIKGIDANDEEIIQAKRVFKEVKNLQLQYGRIEENILQEQLFDVIVFAASIQYFPSFRKIIQQAISLLRLNGEIHILDSPFYKQNELQAARQRSKEYFQKADAMEMNRYYFHHCTDELKMFDSKILHSPNLIKKIFTANYNPFYWVCIQN